MNEQPLPRERKVPVMHPEAMWSIESIAAWCDYAEDYVQNVMILLPDFPKPLRLVGPKSHPRWRAGDVWAWRDGKSAAA